MTTSQEFREWLEANKDILKGRSRRDIADLAIAAGFDSITISQWMSTESFRESSRER